MEKVLKVMLTEDLNEFGRKCAGVLKSEGYDVTLVPKDGYEVIKNIERGVPDVLIMDTFMQHIDALGVMKELKSKSLNKKPLIMLMSSVDNLNLEKEVLSNGADYYFLKPFDVNMISERI
nr:response regulator [Clostridiales bacterium]